MNIHFQMQVIFSNTSDDDREPYLDMLLKLLTIMFHLKVHKNWNL